MRWLQQKILFITLGNSINSTGVIVTVMITKGKRLLALHEQIASIIIREILEGKIELGEKLPSEANLTAEFEVSRPTVRKALALLAEQQIIVTRVGRDGGHFVNDNGKVNEVFFEMYFNMNGFSARDIEQARIAIGIQSAGITALKRTEDDLTELAALLPPVDEPLPSNELFTVVYDFHAVLAKATHNKLLEMLLTAMLPLERLISTYYYLSSRQRAVITRSLYTLYDSICEQNREKTQKEMRKHFAYFRPTVDRFCVEGKVINPCHSKRKISLGELQKVIGGDDWWL